jgi:hypothetical protein
MAISGVGTRIVRTAVFTALCVTLSAGAHVLFSGRPLPLATVAGVTAAVFVLTFLLAGRERRFWHIAALLLPLQLGADTVFTTAQSTCYTAAGAPMPLRPVGFDLLCAGGDFGTPLARLVVGADAAVNPAAPWLLLAVHLTVGLLAAGWLRCGEDALARLLRSAVAAGFRPLRLVMATGTARREPATATAPPVPHRPLTAASPLLSHSVSRRGPPTVFVPTA